MRTSPLGSALLFVAGLAAASPQAVSAQYEVLHAFQGLPGRSEVRLLHASNGQLYGVTSTGGSGGLGGVFVFNPASLGGFGVTMLHDFTREEGGVPLGTLVEGADGALYGTASEFGAGGMGTVFRITKAGALTVLHAFTGPDGRRPVTGLTLADDGNFYGLTSMGGPLNFGTTFRITPAGALTVLHDRGTETLRNELLKGADGNLYGAGFASVYRLALDGTRTSMREFLPAGVAGLAMGLDGHLYGVTNRSAIFASELTFFRLSLDGQLTELHTTEFSAAHVRMSQAPDGALYGTLWLPPGGPTGWAFRLTPSGSFTLLHAFDQTEGTPIGVTRHTNGLFYGVTPDGGIAGMGILYSMTSTGGVLARHHFTDIHGEQPVVAPITGADGALYGTTVKGGYFNRGIVYRLAPDGVLTVLHVFNGLDGTYPYGGLLRATDGLLYGTTLLGGAHGRGTIYRVTPSGGFQTLHAFTAAEGRHPYAGLIQASDGNLYGTTALGGAHDLGTVFKLMPNLSLTTVVSFSGDVRYPIAPVLQARDGDFYGTTHGDGASGGALFRMTPTGEVTQLARYPGSPISLTPGRPFYAGVIEDDAGIMYAAACCDRNSIFDTFDEFFRAEPGVGFATISTIPPFRFSGIAAPFAVDSDGSLFGPMHNPFFGVERIGRWDGGTSFIPLFELPTDETPSGRETFSGFRHAGPGEFVGTTINGGPKIHGTVFRFRVGPMPAGN